MVGDLTTTLRARALSTAESDCREHCGERHSHFTGVDPGKM